ncbi:MerC domain-containing protein [Sphingopyxis sp. LC363]|uniref:MerC domain-containing protein n=1 Tax=Sphingopyxis sp. LC363 TaxID=1120705 RepID=UPI00068EC5C4|nr:MerC domain-containing protein [Sphingopyxis sp. LC363]
MTTNLVEGTAVSASLLCLGHCLALPLILLALPMLAGTFFESEVFHIVAAVLVVPAAALAFLLGYRRHRALLPAQLGAAGVACIVAALFPVWGEPASAAITAIGSLFLIGGHLINWRLRRALG